MNLLIPKTPDQAFASMSAILRGEQTTAEIVVFLRYFQKHAVSPKILSAFLRAIKSSARYTLDTADFDKPVIDIAGTGGDGKHTVNISTLAAIFCAATGLVRVAKYGNRAASSVCGSMDVLEAVGFPIDLELAEIQHNLETVGFAPLFARSVYPGAQQVGEARKQIAGATIFNLLFPLARPLVGNPRFVFGLGDLSNFSLLTQLYQQELNTRCVLVRGLDGTDEVSIAGSGKTHYALINAGQAVTGELDCKIVFDISPVGLSQLQISNTAEAVEMFQKVCDPQLQSERLTAIRNAVFANAAVGLFAGLDVGNFNIAEAKKYFPILEQTLNSGKILQLIDQLKVKNRNAHAFS